MKISIALGNERGVEEMMLNGTLLSKCPWVKTVHRLDLIENSHGDKCYVARCKATIRGCMEAFVRWCLKDDETFKIGWDV